MNEYLQQGAKPRNTQHALFQVSQRLSRGDFEDARRWYPAVLRLSNHSVPEVRNTVAWLMGQDNQYDAFHQALIGLVQDSNPLVRRNAALALVRFKDSRGRQELMSILRPFTLQSPGEGVLRFRLKEDDSVSTGTLLARIEVGATDPFELRSPLPGFVERKLVEEGKQVKAGEDVLALSPSEDQVWEALRALYLIGEPEDLPEIQGFAGKVQHMSQRIQRQAQLTIEAIRNRTG
jgi:HEAT repeat protein